jgi:hypothetical protein
MFYSGVLDKWVAASHGDFVFGGALWVVGLDFGRRGYTLGLTFIGCTWRWWSARCSIVEGIVWTMIMLSPR